jgi:hypothetical protein
VLHQHQSSPTAEDSEGGLKAEGGLQSSAGHLLVRRRALPVLGSSVSSSDTRLALQQAQGEA